MKTKFLLKSKGFTLIETMVAISLLAIAVVGVYTAIQSGIQDTSYSKDQVTAFFMAQEGMEYIKNIRDENALNVIKTPGSRTWLSGISAFTTDPCWYGGGGTGQKTCRIDSPAQQITFCGMSSGTCPNLNQNTTTGLFGYTSGAGWVTTNFKREIRIQQINANEVNIIMTITWVDRSTTHSFQVTESFFNR